MIGQTPKVDRHRLRDFWLSEAQSTKEEKEEKEEEVSSEQKSALTVDCHHVVAGAYLTPQEYRCAESLLRGNTFKKVAAELALSPRTVEFYISNMKKKFQVKKKKALLELLSSVFSAQA